jgi:hypothetical protein
MFFQFFYFIEGEEGDSTGWSSAGCWIIDTAHDPLWPEFPWVAIRRGDYNTNMTQKT